MIANWLMRISHEYRTVQESSSPDPTRSNRDASRDPGNRKYACIQNALLDMQNTPA